MIDERHFKGGLNQDDEDRDLADGDYRFALNLHSGSSDSDNIGAVENAKGNSLVTFPLSGVRNKCIGTYEYKPGTIVTEGSAESNVSFVIYFIWSSARAHQILKYTPESGENGSIERILQGPILNFDEFKLVNGINVVDGKLLYFVDYHNENRKINIEKAIEEGKKREWDLYFPEDAFDFTTGCDYELTVLDKNLVPVAGGYNVCSSDGSPSTDGTLSSGMKNLADDINTTPPPVGFTALNTIIEAEACGKFMHITAKTEGEYTITIVTTNGHESKLVPLNYYPKPFRLEFMDVMKYPPNCEPKVSYRADSDITYNNVGRLVSQFRARYIYDDFEKSAWGPISTIAIDPNAACGEDPNASPNNYIEIDFSDDRLDDSNGSLAILKRVELAFRELNTGIFKSIIQLDTEDFGFGTNVFRFFNDSNYTEIAVTQTNKLFDSIPLRSKSQEVVKNRLIYAGNEEGFDLPCVDARLDVDFVETEDPPTWTITGKIRFTNELNADSDFRFNQPIVKYSDEEGVVYGGMGSTASGFVNDAGSEYKQDVPIRGIVAYLAGTDYAVISIQNDAVAQAHGVTILTGDGNVYDGGSKSKRNAIRSAMQDRDVFSTIQIKGVKPGKYALRIASNHCDTGTGDIFEFGGASLQYQNTSTRAYQVGKPGPGGGGGGTTEGDVHECIITLDDQGGSVDVGEILIADLTDPKINSGNFAVEGYLFDQESPVTADNVRDGQAMELQQVFFMEQDFPYDSFVTDHNGYFFGGSANPNVGFDDKLRIPVVSVTGNPLNPEGVITNFDKNGLSTDRLVVKQPNEALFTGGLTGVLTEESSGEIEVAGNKVVELILYNHNTTVSQIARTIVLGDVTTQDGAPISGINVTIGRGKTGLTDINGQYRITVYADAGENKNNRVTDTIFFGYSGLCDISFPVNALAMELTQFQLNGFYNFTMAFWFLAPERSVSLTTTPLKSILKRGGSYDYGLIYLDDGNRSTATGVAPEDLTKIYIPYFSEDLNKYFPIKFPSPGTFSTGFAQVNWEILSDPPEFATHFQWVRTLNSLSNKSIDWVVNKVLYVKTFDTTSGDPVTGNFGDSDVKEIYLDTKNFIFFAEENSGSQLSYIFEPGDKVRLKRNDQGVAFEEYFDLPIKSQRGAFIIIDSINNLPELKGGLEVEFYTPKKQEETKIFYEIGECYPVITDGTGKKVHSQTTGTFKTGDIYLRGRDMFIQDDSAGVNRVNYSYFIESESISDFYTSRAADIGRVNIVNPDIGFIVRPSNHRFSGVYIPGSKINGLSSFEALNSKDLSREEGLIYKLLFVGNVLLIFFKRKLFGEYIQESLLTDAAGQQIVSITDEFLGSDRSFRKEFGTTHPESVTNHEGLVYFWDNHLGKMIQYAGNDLFAVSKYKMKNFFARKGRELRDPGKELKSEVVTVFDSYFNELIVTFRKYDFTDDPNNPVLTAETLSYNKDQNRWKSFWSFIPECYAAIGEAIISIKNGDLFLHNKNDVYNNFYGEKFTSQIQAIFNQDPRKVKICKALFIDADQEWFAPVIDVPKSATYKNGMKSRLIKGSFVAKEGILYSAIKNDLTDPRHPTQEDALINGRQMRGQSLVVLFESDSEEETVLYGVSLNYINSERSRK